MSSGLSIFVQAAAGQFDAAMLAATGDVKSASMGTAHKVADIVKQGARSDIAAAGFGPRWQNTLKVVVYPQRALSTHPTIQIYHLIPYSGIFEDGGTISGKPLLWLPLSNAPKRIGNSRMTPALYIRQVGPLFRIDRPGHRPLLAANIDTNRRGQSGAAPVTLSALRRGASPGRKTSAVPLFVGVSSVTLRDRFSVQEIADKAADRMPEIFAGAFNSD
ncbi:hypothetical protein ASD12_18040 [Mesorhizobium sp. Root102]|uniref:DUF6441 family protein n=1 Tax=Mesorhizobium sp. Root102 TaxID=1736422 RepID=UPI0006F928AA|nr:DUF6441 family protein [Mesorhizobium sp. Root102]KQU77701.1 hypothetical protein ASD12_18040 [Mesorhizobium sp. Root102]